MAKREPDRARRRARAVEDHGRFAYARLERLLHERARLSILSSLAAHAQGLAFSDLKSLCSLTDGNLSRQLTVLEDAGLVEVEKTTMNHRRHTLCRLTDSGRRRFVQYIAELERVVRDASHGERDIAETMRARPGPAPA